MNGRRTTDSGRFNANQLWLTRFEQVSPLSSCRYHDPGYAPVFQSATGALLTDMAGETWVDLTCGYSATNFGHLFPPLVEAAQNQLTRIAHLTGEPHEQRIRLAEELIELYASYIDARQQTQQVATASEAKVIFNSSGARAVEAAWKAAISFRPGSLIVLAPSLHGRTIATSSISSTNQTSLSHRLAADVRIWPTDAYPHCNLCPLGRTFPECDVACIQTLLHEIENESERISAVLVEPVMTARGYIFPPAEYMQKLRHCTQSRGIVMISDEIQAGLGRCGAIVQSRAQDWQPDLLVFGKSLGGGIVPIAAVIGRADILDSIPAGAESETAAASPLSCAVARRVLELLHEEPLIEAGSRAGQHLRQHVDSVLADLDWPIRVEGQAATCVIECAASQMPISEAQAWARRIASACVRRRLRVQLSGPHSTRIVMLPPLTIQATELQLACERLQEAVQDVAAC